MTSQGRPIVTPTSSGQASLEQELKQRVAELAVLNGENARLLDEARRHAEEITTLAEIGRDISATLDLSIVLERIASHAMEVFNARDVVLRLLEPDGRLPAALAMGKYAGIYKDWDARLGQGLSGDVVRTGVAEIINDPEDDPRVIDIAGTEQDKATRAILFAPLLIGEAVIGVLSIWRDKVDAGPFTYADLDFGLSLARQAAIAIQNARLYAETQQRFKETEILRAANLALTKTFDLDVILGTLLDYLHQVVPYDSGSVFLQEEETFLTARATRGYERWVENPDQAIGIRFEFATSPHIRAVVEEQSTVVIPDVTQYPHWIVAPTARHVRNWLAVPLVAGGKTIGMYSLDKVEPGYFTSEHARLAENLASQAAIAIQNATLFRNQRVAREQAETLRAVTQALSRTLSLQEVFDLILTELQKVVPYDSCSVQQLEGDTTIIVGGRGFPNLDELLGLRFPIIPGDLSSSVISARQPFIVDDVSAQFPHFKNREHGAGRIHGWLGVPLIFGDRLIGMLALDKLEKAFYTPEHAQLALAFAAQAAVAFENARLFETERAAREQAETQAQQVAALNRLAQAVTTTLDLQAVLSVAAREMSQLLNARSVGVGMLNDQRSELRVVAYYSRSDEPSAVGLLIPMEGNLASQQVIETGEAVLIPNAQDTPLQSEATRAVMRARNTHCILIVPLLARGKVIGTMGPDTDEPGRVFTPEQVQLAQTIANQMAGVIENARLYDETLENLRQVEVLMKAASAIQQSVYDPAMVESVAARTDALGELARVFRGMADEVRLREQRLKRQLQQLQLDIEEKQAAKAETVAVYIPMDRRQALANRRNLPEHVHGAALIADVSGFTALTEALTEELGLQRGAEEVIRQLNRVFTVLIDEVHRYGGSVINFSGDAITCWFDDLDTRGVPRAVASAERAVACALAMQQGMVPFATIIRGDGKTISLSIKAAVAVGGARRILVGEGTAHQIDVLAGSTLSALSNAEHLAQKGEVIVATEGAPELAALEEMAIVTEWREGHRYAVLSGMLREVAPAPWAELASDAIPPSQAQPWMLPAVFETVRTGKGDMLSELRQVAALFLKFGGLQYDTDVEAGKRLNNFIQWVEQVIAPYKGSIIQLTVGDKGSYLYVVFGAPIAHEDDAAHAVLAAMELAAPPDSLAYIQGIQIGVTYGQMRVGAYGGSTHRTYGAIGDQTNLAARLMQAATPELAGSIPGRRATILCSDSIHAAAQSQVEFDPLPPITVKGKTQPIPIYRPLRRRSDLNADSATALERAQRIDRLSPAEQLTLKVASVVGQSFTLETVSAVYPEEHNPEELRDHFATLCVMDLIVESSSGTQSYGFRDALTHEVAYNRMLFAQRRQLHRATAELLEQSVSGVPPYAEIARHWHAADEIPKAVQYLEKAGEQAHRMGDFEAATRFFNESLELNR